MLQLSSLLKFLEQCINLNHNNKDINNVHNGPKHNPEMGWGGDLEVGTGKGGMGFQ